MKRLVLVIGLFLNVGLIFAQNKLTKETGDFSELKVYDGISVNLIKSEENKVVVSGVDAASVTVVNNGGKLKIRMSIEKIFNGHETFAEVYYNKPLDVIDANENSFISSDDIIDQVDLEVRSQEAAEIDIDIKIKRLKVKAVTGGIVDLTGDAKNTTVDVNTGGSFDGRELETEQTAVNVNAGGTASVRAVEIVDARVNAGGTILIFGKPKVINKKMFLGGTIKEL